MQSRYFSRENLYRSPSISFSFRSDFDGLSLLLISSEGHETCVNSRAPWTRHMKTAASTQRFIKSGFPAASTISLSSRRGHVT